jgi:mono/diheme cytochrome c family protein
MRKLILTLSLFGFIWACSSTSGEVAQANVDDPDPDGYKIYKTYCVTCHGLYGDMGGSGAYNLTESTLTMEERVAVITNGRNAMASFKTLLSPEKIQAVAAYTLELKSTESE